MTKIAGYGTALAWDPAGGSSYTSIGQVQDISGPGLARDSIDVTTHDSPNAWRQFIKGLKDGGELTFDIVYDPALATHAASAGLLSDFTSQTVIPNWRITFPNTGATVWTFPGFLTGFEEGAPVDDYLSASVTVKVSGAPTLA